ncbi:hypothetical protein ELZ38_02120 [Enterococcus faecalis]|nr:hypothetical protein [Enterococcus faecalis]
MYSVANDSDFNKKYKEIFNRADFYALFFVAFNTMQLAVTYQVLLLSECKISSNFVVKSCP